MKKKKTFDTWEECNKWIRMNLDEDQIHSTNCNMDKEITREDVLNKIANIEFQYYNGSYDITDEQHIHYLINKYAVEASNQLHKELFKQLEEILYDHLTIRGYLWNMNNKEWREINE